MPLIKTGPTGDLRILQLSARGLWLAVSARFSIMNTLSRRAQADYSNGPDFAAAGSTNLGLTDSILALKWVQATIGAFGGDPKRVSNASCLAGKHS
jgi:hypothetical protein